MQYFSNFIFFVVVFLTSYSIVLSTEGDVYVFGRGEWGRLGTGDKKGSSKLRPTRLEPLARMRIVEATAGGTHSIFVVC